MHVDYTCSDAPTQGEFLRYGILHPFLKSFFIWLLHQARMLLGLIDYLAMKVEEIEDVASEHNDVVSSEQVLLQECAELLHQAHDMQVWFH